MNTAMDPFGDLPPPSTKPTPAAPPPPARTPPTAVDPFGDLPPPSTKPTPAAPPPPAKTPPTAVDPFGDLPPPSTKPTPAAPPPPAKTPPTAVDPFGDLPPPGAHPSSPLPPASAVTVVAGRDEPARKRARAEAAQVVAYVASRRGRRETMQDAYTVEPELAVAGGERALYAAVFDGHAGGNASAYARDHLHGHLQAQLAVALARPGASTDAAVKEALLLAFKRTDTEFLARAAEQGWRDGSTALVALVLDGAVHLANLGDCKAVLAVRRDGDAQPRAVELTHDHSPVVWEERQRIQKAGGTVVEGRVLGQLEVSRALGDGRFKTVGVISTPEVVRHVISPQDAFILLACDGLFKGLTPAAAVEVVSKAIAAPATDGVPPAQAAATAVVNEAIRQGSTDNVTAILLVPIR